MHSDAATILAVVTAQGAHPWVLDRIASNVTRDPVIPDEDAFWAQLTISLLSSQQKSTEGSPLSLFAQLRPFPLELETYLGLTDSEVESIIGKHGLRFGKRVAGFLRQNYAWLFGPESGWQVVREHLQQLALQRSNSPAPSQKTAERAVARMLAEHLAGIGPKQSRNLIQELGLTRYEIPLDSRVAGWLIRNLHWSIDTGQLIHHQYYERLLDRVQESCELAGVLPTVFDVAAFVVGKSAEPPSTTTHVGFVNRNGQVVIRNSGLPGNDHLQSAYQLGCSECGHVYGANGSDIHLRLCPSCQNGAKGLSY